MSLHTQLLDITKIHRKLILFYQIGHLKRWPYRLECVTTTSSYYIDIEDNYETPYHVIEKETRKDLSAHQELQRVKLETELKTLWAKFCQTVHAIPFFKNADLHICAMGLNQLPDLQITLFGSHIGAYTDTISSRRYSKLEHITAYLDIIENIASKVVPTSEHPYKMWGKQYETGCIMARSAQEARLLFTLISNPPLQGRGQIHQNIFMKANEDETSLLYENLLEQITS
jgi:hypothetical protein